MKVGIIRAGNVGIERKLLIECDNKEKELLRNSINKLDEVYQSIK